MTCQDMRAKLQELLDRALDRQESARVREHMSGCAPCRAHYRQLESLARALAGLPDFSPSAAFGAKVAAALALPAAAPFPRWAKWSMGALGSLASCSATAVLLLIASRLDVWRAVGAWAALAEPGRSAVLAKLYLAKSILMLSDCLTGLLTLGRLFGPRGEVLPVQLLAAAAIAGIYVAVVSKGALAGAVAGKWRSI